MSEYPTFSAIMPTFNRAEVVARTLAHLAAQRYPMDRLEIIVVDNSHDDTPDRVAAAASEFATRGGPRVVLLSVDERLPAVKRNLGLRAATGELILWMNDDLWLDADALRAHAEAHRRQDRPVAVLGHCRQSPEMAQTPFIAAFEPFAYHLLTENDGQNLAYSYFWTMNLSVPRAVMVERNLVFHEDWRHIGHEDVELGWRWRQAGLSLLYEPGASGDHFHPHTVASASRVQDAVGRGLHDLEALIPDPDLLARYGVRHRSNRPAVYARYLLRDLLFNRFSVPRLQRHLDARTRGGPIDRWLYWKVLLHATGLGYRSETSRPLAATPTYSPLTLAASGQVAT